MNKKLTQNIFLNKKSKYDLGCNINYSKIKPLEYKEEPIKSKRKQKKEHIFTKLKKLLPKAKDLGYNWVDLIKSNSRQRSQT